MVNRRLLFTAPYEFLPRELLEAYQRLMPTTFREIWHRDDLRTQEDAAVWVMNPGQQFVIDDDVLARFPQLEVLSTPSTGRNHIDLAACARRGIAVYSLLDHRPVLDSISASAEFSFLLLLNALRRLDRGMSEVASGRWRAREDWLRGSEIAGKLVGLVGYGRIGRRLARYCRAFDAQVVYHDPYVTAADAPALPLERLFAECDVVCVCCTLTPETNRMVDGRLLRRLKEGATFVNTARGEIVVEEDLAQLLAERADVRVAVDVLAGEVRASQNDSPLMRWAGEGRIVITPHIAGAAVESQTKAALGALQLVERHYAGTPAAELR